MEEGVDFWVCETFLHVGEARIALERAKKTGLPVMGQKGFPDKLAKSTGTPRPGGDLAWPVCQSANPDSRGKLLTCDGVRIFRTSLPPATGARGFGNSPRARQTGNLGNLPDATPLVVVPCCHVHVAHGGHFRTTLRSSGGRAGSPKDDRRGASSHYFR